MTSTVTVHCAPYGDSAVLVRTSGGNREQRWAAVQSLAEAARRSAPGCVMDTVAAYETLLIQIRTAPHCHVEVAQWVRDTHDAIGDTARVVGRVIDIPVVYGGDHGPDLEPVAADLNMTPEQLVDRHSTTRWTVRMLGSPVGAPMMDGGDLPAPIQRCAEPRTAVPAGSVALAGQQCVIYPVRSPGGWRLIGRTPLRLTDVNQTPPTRHRPGDIIRFRPIHEQQWHDLAGTLPQVRHE